MQFSMIVWSRVQGEEQSETSISLTLPKLKSLSESEPGIYCLSIAERFVAAISNKIINKRVAKSEIWAALVRPFKYGNLVVMLFVVLMLFVVQIVN